MTTCDKYNLTPTHYIYSKSNHTPTFKATMWLTTLLCPVLRRPLTHLTEMLSPFIILTPITCIVKTSRKGPSETLTYNFPSLQTIPHSRHRPLSACLPQMSHTTPHWTTIFLAFFGQLHHPRLSYHQNTQTPQCSIHGKLSQTPNLVQKFPSPFC